MRIRSRFPLLLAVVISCGIAAAAAGQQPPPIHGLTGTIALPANVDEFYDGMNKLLVKTGDGVDHVMHVTKGTKVHGGEASLGSLTPGTPVVVHYTVKGIQASAVEIDRIGPDGLKQNEGVVTRVDRAKRRIAIRFPTGETQSLRLTRYAALPTDGHAHRGSRVIVYYSDESGQRVAHYFKLAH